MDYLQYIVVRNMSGCACGFKPYYKWITFNTGNTSIEESLKLLVLNLIINGLPSILK